MISERAVDDTPFDEDFEEIKRLYDIWSSALGHTSDNKPKSYDPILERRQFEKIHTETDEIAFRKHAEVQIKTALKERLHCIRSSVTYATDDQEFYNEFFPTEPFSRVLLRGIEYRKSIGSTEQEREQAELKGCLKIFDELTSSETKVGTKIMVISGPGLVDKTAYPHNFVDIYEKTLNPKDEIAVRMTRTASELTYDDYARRIVLSKPDYFVNFSGPLDAWFLAQPIPLDSSSALSLAEGILEDALNTKPDWIDEKTFEKILENCMPLVLNYIDILCQEEYSPRQIAIAFNAILNKADYEKIEITQKNTGSNNKSRYVFKNVKEEANFLGRQSVQMIDGDCGLSVGFAINPLSNSVAAFGMRDHMGPLMFKCERGHENVRPFGQKIKHCKTCGVSVDC